ncbi:MAG: undecaprenyl-phosphate glucose phosphotransferase [Chloroflexi bacterium]|nr:undecaprenyl-phosphate glucose phosphotransferase [Chloroflexota bacterium]
MSAGAAPAQHPLVSVSRRRPIFFSSAAMVVLDAVLIALAFYLAHRWRIGTEYPRPQNIQSFRFYLPMLLVQELCIIGMFFFYKLYHRKRSTSHLDEVAAIFAAVSVGTTISTAIISFAFKSDFDYPRLMIVYAWGLSFALVATGRIVHARLQWALQTSGFGATKVIVVGAGEAGQMIVSTIKKSPGLGYRLVGVVDDRPCDGDMGVPWLGPTAQLGELIDQHQVGEVFVGMPDAPHQKILNIISNAQRDQVGIKIFPDIFQIISSPVGIGDLSGLPMVTVRDVALRGWRLTLKRALDVVISASILILSSPVLLVTAILIKLDSPGSVFYTQVRMGLDARPFAILKFRTMRTDAEMSGPGWTVKNDPRKTRLGVFLRRFHVDEMPQFINVLLGDMSIVGPRPERPVFVEQFRRLVPRYMERHQEKAGITGWAQVNGLRGDTSIVERTKYDLYYIENWSLLFDIKIILRTIWVALSGQSE